jgi:flagellar assembly factor FliW
MRSIETPRFGLVRFDDQEIIEFPAGLPGFEEEHEFLLIESPESLPLRFLQSVATPTLSFVCAPIALVDPSYEGNLSKTDREILALPESEIGPAQLEWLAILCFAQADLPTANLLGPLVIRRDLGLGVQSIRDDARHSAKHPLFRQAENPSGGDSC